MTEPRMFLQKLVETGTAVRADMVSPDNKRHSIKKQCELPGISRNAYYYEPRVSESRQMLMRHIDELYTENPAAGQRSLQASLLRRYGIKVGRCAGSEAVPVRPGHSAQEVSLSLAQRRHKPREPGLEHGHHLHQAEERIRPPDGGHRLVWQTDTFMEAVNDIEH
jgi:hypothetical protein